MKLLGLVVAAVASVFVPGQALAQQRSRKCRCSFSDRRRSAHSCLRSSRPRSSTRSTASISSSPSGRQTHTSCSSTPANFQLGGSAALLNVGLAVEKGVKVVYLFNIFNYWSYVVTSRPDVKTLKDLEGKEMAAAKSTSAYRIMTWFAKQQGVDMDKVAVVNTAPPGLGELHPRRPRRGGAHVGSGLRSAEVEKTRDSHARPEDCGNLEEFYRRHLPFPILELPRTRRGWKRTSTSSRSCSIPTRMPRSGRSPIRMKPASSSSTRRHPRLRRAWRS